MSSLALHPAPTYAPPLRRSVERLRGAMLWFTGFAGAVVFMEPSPYEIASLLTIIVFVTTGLTLRPALMPLIVMLVLYNTGFALSVIQVIDQSKPVIWVAVSWYLSATAVFFAAMLLHNTKERLDLLMRGIIAAGTVASTVAILAYFHLIGRASDFFLMYDRAKAAFNDPNVLGAFLILPALLMLQRILTRNIGGAIRAAVPLSLMVIALLLSFSRAAWGQLAFCGVLLMFLTFVTTRSTTERMRIVVIAVVGVVMLVLMLAAILSIDRVAQLFEQRASLEQSYDVGHLGRFGRHILGALLALDKPFGIGPLQFHFLFPEDVHNTYLNSFMSGGWLSGVVYLTMTLTTLWLGFRTVFMDTPWRHTYLAIYCAYVGTAGESAIIDSDHWRHYFLLVGTIWGLAVASRAYVRQKSAPARPAGARALAPAGGAA